MWNNIDKPILKTYSPNEWEFVYPDSIKNEYTKNEYWHTLELLDQKVKTAERKFKKLILKHPYFLDAYNYLSIAYRNQRMPFESLLTAEKSYSLGKECFPSEFNLKKDKLPWSCIDNRPFLRACHIYGLECHYHKNYEMVIKIYNEILNLNINDNQGIRYLLLQIYLNNNELNEARTLIENYQNDISIEFKFGALAIEILENNITTADRIYNEAILTNNYLVDEIIKDKHIQPQLNRNPEDPYEFPCGSIQEAYEYWKNNKILYSNKKIKNYLKRKIRP